MPAGFRVSPTMSSSRIAALAFIRQFIADWGEGPTLSEISNGTGLTKQSAYRAVRGLKRTGAIRHLPGVERGIALAITDDPPPISAAHAIEILRAEGFVVDDDVLCLNLPIGPIATPVTNPRLPLLDALEHIPETEFPGDSHDHKRAAR